MLDQIESALYAEDPKFASTVRAGRVGGASGRRRLQAAALFVLGLVLLVAGVALPLRLGGFPVLSLFGFLVMFGAAVMLLVGGTVSRAGGAARPASGRGSASGRGAGGGRRLGKRGGGGFSARMEERFRRRFE